MTLYLTMVVVVSVAVFSFWSLLSANPLPLPSLRATADAKGYLRLLYTFAKALLFFNAMTHASFVLTSSHAPKNPTIWSLLNALDFATHLFISISSLSPLLCGSHQAMALWHAAKKIYSPWKRVAVANWLDALTYVLSSFHLLYRHPDKRTTIGAFLLGTSTYAILKANDLAY